ncbi:MAG: hypothetical protein HY741_14110 [Chloroflexi bacterium]|nr:hypothetical protein [Chloroflexota bacterium]
MLQQAKAQQLTNDVHVVGALTTHGRGIVAGNPKLCLNCGKPIRAGEAWVKQTSAPDPEFGTYSFIVHARCSGHQT